MKNIKFSMKGLWRILVFVVKLIFVLIPLIFAINSFINSESLKGFSYLLTAVIFFIAINIEFIEIFESLTIKILTGVLIVLGIIGFFNKAHDITNSNNSHILSVVLKVKYCHSEHQSYDYDWESFDHLKEKTVNACALQDVNNFSDLTYEAFKVDLDPLSGFVLNAKDDMKKKANKNCSELFNELKSMCPKAFENSY